MLQKPCNTKIQDNYVTLYLLGPCVHAQNIKSNVLVMIRFNNTLTPF